MATLLRPLLTVLLLLAILLPAVATTSLPPSALPALPTLNASSTNLTVSGVS